MINRTENDITSTWKYGNFERPVVTVRVITFNHERFIEEALNGILSQTTDYAFRVLIHDDASKDKTVAILKEYSSHFPHIIELILQEENQYSKKDGTIPRVTFPRCNGDYLAFCEGDDYWIDPYKIQKQISYLQNNKDYSAVYGNVIPVNKYSEYDESLSGMYKWLDEGDYNDLEISRGILKTQLATLVCKNVFKGLNSESFETYIRCRANGDEKLLIMLSAYGKIHYLSDVLAAHRKVLDEGDSWSAMRHSLSSAQRLKMDYKRQMELTELYRYFHHKEMRIWEDLMFQRLYIIKQFFLEKNENEKSVYRSILEDHSVYQHIDYSMFAIQFVKRIINKFITLD